MRDIFSKEKLRVLFTETLVIATGMLFGIGVEGIVLKLMGNPLSLGWYQPMAIILTAFLSALITVVIFAKESVTRTTEIIRVIIHFVLLLGVISLAGYFFDWFDSVGLYIAMVTIYFFVYLFSWLANLFILRNDARIINDALNEIRDEE